MESFDLLIGGFATALQPGNLLFAFIGCLLGTLIGVLPGVGPAAGTAILLPITFVLEPTPAIIMLSAIYYGGMYGGTITSVLINTPGEAASAVTCLDGYEMAKRGRAGAALSIAAIGSFVGGSISTLLLALVALPLARLALAFGPPEQFALMVLGISLVTSLTGKSMVRGLLSATLGLLLASVGVDPISGMLRYTFGQASLLDGISIIPVVMGLFGISEILLNAESPERRILQRNVGSLWVTKDELRASIPAVLRGSGLGFGIGMIPGAGPMVAAFMSYILEKKLSRTPDKFGTGMIEGVAGPETANNACVTSSLVPLFSLGIPTTATAAVLLGAFMMNGLAPGPLLFRDHGEIVWAVIASLYIGNVILLVLNLPLVPLWVTLLRVPYSILFTMILLFCVIGAYGSRQSAFDVGVMLACGVLGYIFKKTDVPMAPAVLTMVLAPMMEKGLRRSLEISGGDVTILFTRPLSGALLAAAALAIAASALQIIRKEVAEDS